MPAFCKQIAIDRFSKKATENIENTLNRTVNINMVTL